MHNVHHQYRNQCKVCNISTVISAHQTDTLQLSCNLLQPQNLQRHQVHYRVRFTIKLQFTVYSIPAVQCTVHMMYSAELLPAVQCTEHLLYSVQYTCCRVYS